MQNKEGGTDLLDPAQDGVLPHTLVFEMSETRITLLDVEIDRTVAEKGLLAKVNEPKECRIEWSGVEAFEPLVSLKQFLDLFFDGSIQLGFDKCLAAIDAKLTGEPVWEESLSHLEALRTPTYTVPKESIETIIKNRML